MKKTILSLLITSMFIGGCTLKPETKDKVNGEAREGGLDQVLPEIQDTKTEEAEIIKEVEISPEEQEFNDSGQAKAIEDETDLWSFYNNPEVGFSFNYPPEIILLDEKTNMDNLQQMYLEIEILNIGEKINPWDFDKEEAMKNIEALTSGKFGTAYGFAFEESQQVKSVGFLFAQDYMVLARFEVCDVALERKLRFYFNNKQVTLTLFGPEKLLITTMPEYFQTDTDNCSDIAMWDFEKQGDFYKTLVNGNGSPVIQKWFDTFDKISEEIIFAHR